MEKLKSVTLFTEVFCLEDNSRGGYGVILLYGTHRKELSGGFRSTTTSRLQMRGIIRGLRSLKYRCEVTVITDDQCLIENMNKGVFRKMSRRNLLQQSLMDLCVINEVHFVLRDKDRCLPESHRCSCLARDITQSNDLSDDLDHIIYIPEYKKAYREGGYTSSGETLWVYDSEAEDSYIYSDSEENYSGSRIRTAEYEDEKPSWDHTKRMQRDTANEYYYNDDLEDDE